MDSRPEPDLAEVEIARGRFWRAKEILRGRLAASSYDVVLFARYADVLAAMHDDDEAGRFDLLAGRADGEAGERARAFLARRSKGSFAQLWSGMPAACRRGDVPEPPAGTMALLAEAGFQPQAVLRHLAEAARRRADRIARSGSSAARMAAIARERRVSIVVGVVLFFVLAIGVIGTLRILSWAFWKVFGY